MVVDMDMVIDMDVDMDENLKLNIDSNIKGYKKGWSLKGWSFQGCLYKTGFISAGAIIIFLIASSIAIVPVTYVINKSGFDIRKLASGDPCCGGNVDCMTWDCVELRPQWCQTKMGTGYNESTQSCGIPAGGGDGNTGNNSNTGSGDGGSSQSSCSGSEVINTWIGECIDGSKQISRTLCDGRVDTDFEPCGSNAGRSGSSGGSSSGGSGGEAAQSVGGISCGNDSTNSCASIAGDLAYQACSQRGGSHDTCYQEAQDAYYAQASKTPPTQNQSNHDHVQDQIDTRLATHLQQQQVTLQDIPSEQLQSYTEASNQLAQTYISQGKTDLSQEDLQQAFSQALTNSGIDQTIESITSPQEENEELPFSEFGYRLQGTQCVACTSSTPERILQEQCIPTDTCQTLMANAIIESTGADLDLSAPSGYYRIVMGSSADTPQCFACTNQEKQSNSNCSLTRSGCLAVAQRRLTDRQIMVERGCYITNDNCNSRTTQNCELASSFQSESLCNQALEVEIRRQAQESVEQSSELPFCGSGGIAVQNCYTWVPI